MEWNKDTPCWSSTPKHQEPVLLALWTRRNRRLSPKVHPWIFSSCLQALWRLEPLIIKRETVGKCFAKSQRESGEESKVSKLSSYVFSRVSFQRNQNSFEGLAYTVCIYTYNTSGIWYVICVVLGLRQSLEALDHRMSKCKPWANISFCQNCENDKTTRTKWEKYGKVTFWGRTFVPWDLLWNLQIWPKLRSASVQVCVSWGRCNTSPVAKLQLVSSHFCHCIYSNMQPNDSQK